MCDVCCADAAVDETNEGRPKRFVWNPESEPTGLANNLDASPHADYVVTPADWPFVLVMAETYEEHVEGDGRFKFGFDADDMGDWIESTYLSMDIDGLLCVSWAWDFVDDEVKALILARDREGLLKLLEAPDEDG